MLGNSRTSTISVKKRVIQQPVADGQIPGGAPTGTPDEPYRKTTVIVRVADISGLPSGGIARTVTT